MFSCYAFSTLKRPVDPVISIESLDKDVRISEQNALLIRLKWDKMMSILKTSIMSATPKTLRLVRE